LKTRFFIAFLAAIFLNVIIAGCKGEVKQKQGEEAVTIVFKHGKIAGDPEAFRAILDRFEEENPGILVADETLPAL
jgi:ABC-type glycerol-3-phosphate transport system substrate-binding protein